MSEPQIGEIVKLQLKQVSSLAFQRTSRQVPNSPLTPNKRRDYKPLPQQLGQRFSMFPHSTLGRALTLLSPMIRFALRWAAKAPFNNRITLISSKSQTKLVAQIVSTGPTLAPNHLTPGVLVKFVLSWWWFGIVTFPRILKEAGRLFSSKRLHVWYRPEVLRGSMGRRATELEK